MLTSDFTFDLPEELIAAWPAERRDASRLMVLPGRELDAIEHRRFSQIGDYLRPGDLLVVNDSRVLPARLYARRPSGGQVELLLLNEEAPGGEPVWRVLGRPARKLSVGQALVVAAGELEATITAEHEGGERSVRFVPRGADFRTLLSRHGQMPLPPYILKRRAEEQPACDREALVDDRDRERYQTVYARAEGSIAAPTAGLHFTPELLEALQAGGVGLTRVTLHVGAGTFQTMAEEGRVEEHRMHHEEYEVPPGAAEAVNETRRRGGRIICVGTTSVRTLESAADGETGLLRVGSGSTNLMIVPGHRFRLVDGLITNFHLPRSTLLLLVSALMGRERILRSYEVAVREGYRFFSYGDAMLLLPNG